MKKILSLSMVAILGVSLLGLIGCTGNTSTGSENTANAGDAGSTNSSEAQASSGEPLVVAMELAYPPFETKDEAGEPSGISVELAMALGEYLGREVEISDTAWDGLIPSLQTGRADLIISSMTITQAREEEVNFSDPYANALLAVLTNTESNIADIEDLNQEGRRVAVKTGSTGFLYAQEHLPNAEIIALADESACVTEVAQGRADGFIYDQLTIYRNNEQNTGTTTALFLPFQEPESWGIAVAEDNEELLAQVNAFLAEFTADGGFDRLTEQYLSEEKESFDELGFQWVFPEAGVYLHQRTPKKPRFGKHVLIFYC